MRRPLRSGAIAALLAFVACGAAPKPTPAPSATPAAGAGPRVVMPSSAVYALEIARTPEEQTQGLMYRESLPANTGMIFLFTDGGAHHFWMKNTMIPLDIIWMDGDGKVLFVSANTPPCKSDPCPTYGPEAPASTVLEIAGGLAGKEGVKAGAVLTLRDVK